MNRLNVKLMSILTVLSLLLVGLVSVEVMADPVQEQEECTDSGCPNVNIGGETVTLDLPAGPFLRLEGTGVELDILGQTLSGDFVFEKVTPPPSIITITPNTSSRSGLIVPIRGDDSSSDRRFAEGAQVFFGGCEACADTITPSTGLGDGTADSVTLDLPDDGLFLRVQGTGVELDILGQTLSGDFAFEQATSPGTSGITSLFLHGGAGNDRFLLKSSQAANGILGSGVGNMYINAAYGTTRADVPVCDFCVSYCIAVWVDVEPEPIQLMVKPKVSVHPKLCFGPLDEGFRLHYDSGKADGTIAQRQTVLGYGWTTNYNLYLVKQPSDIFMADGKGRMTRFKKNGSVYTPSDGQTHRLTKLDPNTFLLEEVDGTSMTFVSPDSAPWWADGNDVYMVKEIEDTRGRTIDLSYDSNALLETITDPYGQQINLSYSEYSGKMLLDSITDPNMQVTDINYINDGNDLWKVTDPEGHTITYSYNTNHLMTSAQLKDGNTWTCDYSSGKPWRITDPNSDIYVTVVNSENWARDVSHPDSNEFRYYSSKTTVTDGEGNITTFDLDKNGYVTTLGHPNHPNETFVFDSNLRLTRIIDQEDNSWLYAYDSNGNPTEANDPLGNSIQMSYKHPNIPSLCTKMTEPDGDIWQFEWNSQGDLTKVIDPIVDSPNDKVVTYSYTYYPGEPNGRFQLITRTDRNGHVTQLELDPNSNIERTVIDPCGLELTAEYEHDEIGRVTKRTAYRQAGSPNSVVTEYTYDSMGRLIESVLDPNPLNLSTQYQYDGAGRLVKITNPRGIVTDYAYDVRGWLTTKTFDPCGLALATGFKYDGCNNLIKLIDPNSNETDYSYDDLNRLIEIIDAVGYLTEYEYDELSNLTLAKRSIDPGIPLYRSVKYSYDKLNRLTQRIADPCDLALTTGFQYASAGGGVGRGTPGTSLVHKTTDAESNVTYYYYDKLDRLTSVVRKVGDTNDNGGDPNDAVIDYEYDSVGNRIRTVVQNAPDPNLVTTNSFDAANRLIKQVLDPCDANLVTTYTYDGTGSLIQLVTPSGNAIIYTYDKANRLTDVNDSIGAVAGYSYDKNGNILTEADGLGNTWKFTYDNADRLTNACDPLVEQPNDKFASYQYDKNGNLVKKTDNEALVTDYEYDGLNRLISKTKDPCGLNITNTLAYDGLGNIVLAADDNDNSTIYQYDGVNRLIRIEYADSTEEIFIYDSVGNLIDASDRMGSSTTYSYDDLHRMIQRTYADSNSDTFTYDRAGQMLSADNSHSHIGYTYDGVGRTISTTQTDLPLTYSYTVGYAYTTEPNYTRTITYPDGNDVNEVYDVRIRLAEVEHNGSTVVQYTYQDPGDRLLKKQFANATKAELTWNENDQVTKLIHKASDDSNLVGFEYAYDAVGNQLSAENLQQALPYDNNKPATHSAVYSYDSIYRLTEFRRGLMVGDVISSPTRRRTWTLDGVNNWQQFSIQDTLDNSENGTYNNSTNQMNEYDDPSTNGSPPIPDDDGKPDDFMVNTNPSSGDFQPDGDVDFNDLAVIASHWLDSDCCDPGWCGGADIDQSSGVELVDYARFADNWLDTTSGFYNCAHDKNGNLVDDDIMEYYWDYDHRPIDTAVLRAANLLTQVRRKSDSQILGQYLYDALGRRIQKSAAGTSTVYVYDGWQVLAEYENDAFARRYAYGEAIDELLTMDNAAVGRCYFHADSMGSTIAVTDAAGMVTERCAYDAYGQPYFFDTDGNDISQSAIDNPYLFTARRYDDETGLYYYRTRYLHPQRGRFISPDTIGIWGDPANLGNPYTYVANSPASHVDPFGLQSGIDLSGPRGKRKKTYTFKYQPQHLEGLKKANVMVSYQEYLDLKADDPAAKILQSCGKVTFIGVQGEEIRGKKG